MEPITPCAEQCCPLCGAPLVSVWTSCPKCGEPVNGFIPSTNVSLDRKFAPATFEDRVALAGCLFVSLAITFPMVEGLLYALSEGKYLPFALLLFVLTMGPLWGFPLFMSVSQRKNAIRAGVTNHSHMLRCFWKYQGLVLLIPLALFVMLLMTCAVG